MSIQITKIRKQVSRERFGTEESVALTKTLCRAGHVTQPFIIMLWTVGPAITQVVSVHTHSAVKTAVKARASHVFTQFFVFMVHAVVPTIAACVDREAVTVPTIAACVDREAVTVPTIAACVDREAVTVLPGAQIMGLRTRFAAIHLLHSKGYLPSNVMRTGDLISSKRDTL